VFDRDGTMIVRVELPGLDPKDVDVRVEDQMLVVEGERQDDRPEEGGPRSGWGYGPFRREIALPQSADPSDLRGRFRNGLLEVAVPQPRREERRKRIKVEAA
jgi:HSP20 family protein